MAFNAPDITGMGIYKGMKTTASAMSACERAVAVHTSATLVSIPQAATSYAISQKKLRVKKARVSAGGGGRFSQVAMLY